MSCCGYIYEELLCMGKLTVPSIILFSQESGFVLLDMIMVGHVGKTPFAIAALGSAFYNILWYIMEGVLTAQDTLTSHAFSSRDIVSVRRWGYVAAVVSLLLSIIATFVVLSGYGIITQIFGIEGYLADYVWYYLLTLLPAYWCSGLFRVIQKYFQSQHIMRPAMLVLGAGLIVKFILNYILLFVMQAGAVGSASATTLSKCFMLGAMVWYLKIHFQSTRQNEGEAIASNALVRSELFTLLSWFRLSAKIAPVTASTAATAKDIEMTTIPDRDEEEKNEEADTLKETDTLISNTNSSASHLQWTVHEVTAALIRFVLLGVPAAVVLVVEMWSLDLITLLASHVGEVTVGAQQILLTWIRFVFMSLPFAVSVSATIRVQSLLAAQHVRAARTASNVAIMIAVLLSCLSGYLLYAISDIIGYIFTSDPNIIYRVSGLAPLAALFSVAQGIHGVAHGILRGMNHVKDALVFTIACYWVVALPIGIYWAFVARPSYGMHGLWYGFITGGGALTVMLLIIVLSSDWEREVRRARVRAEKLVRNREVLQAGVVVGSMSMGGFTIISASEDDEIDDLERIEVHLQPHAL